MYNSGARGLALRLALAIACSSAPVLVHAQEGGAPPELAPPVLLESLEPSYPLARIETGEEPTVYLHVTVEADGTVSDAHPEAEHDAAFDEAAVSAVRTWRFAPARRRGEAIRARARVGVRFRRPADLDTGSEHPGPEEGRVEGTTTQPEPESEGEGEGEGDSELPAYSASGAVDPLHDARAPRASSEYVLSADLITAAPHRDAGDLLMTAPGVYVARGEGDGVAHDISLRGFDAEHGQDIELTMGGIPLNAPSHLHGQGYTDLGFLIPEVVSAIRVTAGVYDPHQGDFAIAGSIGFDLGVAERGVTARATYGSFDTFRALLLWAPTGERDGTFGAVTFRRTNGFGAQRAGESGSTILQYELGGDGNVRARITAALSGARYGLAGVLRYDDVSAGRVPFLGAYPDPTATSQSSFALRALLGGTLELVGENGSFGELGIWLGYSDFRLLANYTGYTQPLDDDDPTSPRLGDLVEQLDTAFSLGLHGRWRSERFTPFDWLNGFVELGLRGRVDVRDQRQSMVDAATGDLWARRVDADVRAGDVGAFVDLDLHVTERVHLRGGVRADVLVYGIDDALAAHGVAPRRSAVGVAAGPRVSLELVPVHGLTFSIAYGEGFRSPQATSLVDGQTVPFARVRSGDLGGRLEAGEHHELTTTLSGFIANVSDDVAFEPGEGRLEPIGQTTRIGGAIYVVARPLSWLVGAISVTYVRATLDAPPPDVPGAPMPYRSGDPLPYVAPLVIRVDAGADEQVTTLLDLPFRIRGGAGFSLLGSRPLPYGESAAPLALLDLSAGVTWGPIDLGVEVQNLLDQRYAALEYSFVSSWSPTASPSSVPARSFSAGAPLTVLVSLGARFE
jgi:iron complex outermembrane receptor protein